MMERIIGMQDTAILVIECVCNAHCDLIGINLFFETLHSIANGYIFLIWTFCKNMQGLFSFIYNGVPRARWDQWHKNQNKT